MAQESVTAYKDWLKDNENQAISTITAKLSHVKKYLDVAYGKKVYANFFKGRVEPKNPH